MKLIIQMPCYNEEKTLSVALQSLPRQVEGFDQVEWLLIDDGSTDRSIEVAKESGIDHIVKLTTNKGLAEVFSKGLDACVKLGADVIVNTDADNQYDAGDIPKLVKPILDGKAEIVIGSRPIADIPHFSPIKKMLQKLGSWVVRRLSYTNIPDAPSGFRAISRDAAMKLNVFNTYTYTLETIIQAGNKHIAITSVPIQVNDDLRPSKLVKSIYSYVTNSILTIFRIFIVYRPFKFFMTIGLFFSSLGFLLGLRFLFFYFTGGGAGHVQSLILTAVLLGLGFQVMLTAFLADLLAVNRILGEDVLNRLKKHEADERLTKNLALSNQRLRESLSMEFIRDPLTGLYTQRYVQAFLEQEAHRLEHRNAPMGFIFFEIDSFQETLDTYGRDVCDTVLRELGVLLRSNTRGDNIACRYSEDTFWLILLNASFQVTQHRARELQEMIKSLKITHQNTTLNLSSSLGVAALPEHGPDIADSIKAADAALNQAKREGRDRIVVALT